MSDGAKIQWHVVYADGTNFTVNLDTELNYHEVAQIALNDTDGIIVKLERLVNKDSVTTLVQPKSWQQAIDNASLGDE
jgi:hypothetical protein